jgi:DNA-directed RNA polymerase, mitochondrial
VYSQTEWNRLLEVQEDLEDFSDYRGRDRYYRRIEQAQEGGRGSTVGATRRLLAEAVDPTEEAIRWSAEESLAKRGPTPIGVKWAQALGYDVAAFLVARVVLDGIGQEAQDFKKLCLHIARLSVHELRYRRFREEAPGLFHYRMNSFDTDSYAHRSRSLNAAMSYADVNVDDLDLSMRERILVGSWLLSKFVEATGLVHQETVRTDRTTTNTVIVPSEGTVQWIKSRNEVLEGLKPLRAPMVVPPLPWSKHQKGGFRFALRDMHNLIRGWSSNPFQPDEHDYQQVYSAVNRLQETAWQVNPLVWSLVLDLEARGGDVAGIPPLNDEPMPDRAPVLAEMKRDGLCLDVTLTGDEADGPENEVKRFYSELRYRRGLVHNRNHERGLKEIGYRRVMEMASKLASKPAIFFAYSLDFRGRIYPMVDYLSPQGPDLEKALLRFADTKPIGTDGPKWLANHLMNCLGDTPEGAKVGMMPFSERLRWVDENTDRILGVADDPLGDLWWTDADKPLQFYAACDEWAAYVRSGYSPEFESGLPVAMDGSCNGLQHFAAMFRDPVGGEAVNVIPGDTPNDVYSRVAERVLDILQDEAADEPLAARWLASGLVDRKLCKRPTMTFGYGSKPYGFAAQIVEYLDKDVEQGALEVFRVDGEIDLFPAASYMANAIWMALQGTVVKAFEAMEWLQACARALARDGKPVEWTVPETGLRVRQDYWSLESKRVETILAGTLIKPRYYHPGDRPDAHKQTNGIAPNLVHSLDAAALMLTVNAAANEGIEAFGMVHDSYSTVAGDAEALAGILRQEFAALYRSNLPQRLKDEWNMLAETEEIPEPPVMGDMDPDLVITSDYFFS